MNEVTMAKPEKIDGIDKWEVENAARTLVEAEEIKNKPKLLAAARKVINQKLIATQQAKLEAAQAAGKK